MKWNSEAPYKWQPDPERTRSAVLQTALKVALEATNTSGKFECSLLIRIPYFGRGMLNRMVSAGFLEPVGGSWLQQYRATKLAAQELDRLLNR